ncbi:CIC11C00000004215 [Sungouiella intermedia]|uniref:CIC11C00000004215 n=1 Tax=Sungouiella intermedia TaxID=45354 RepID=A0A1L0C0P3_9ASCO|nr:CIC11C00000004215 [[Candida] intermedia]
MGWMFLAETGGVNDDGGIGISMTFRDKLAMDVNAMVLLVSRDIGQFRQLRVLMVWAGHAGS